MAHNGRRGKRHQKQAQRLARKEELKEQARRVEIEQRAPLIARIRPWMIALCKRSSCGIATDVVDRHLFAAGPYFTLFCPEGRVTVSTIGVDTVDIKLVQPWSEMTTSYLSSISKRRWVPYRPKNILDLIVDSVSIMAWLACA